MARLIRVPLDMGNGKQVNTIEELRQNFNIEKILEHYHSGSLEKWLERRGMKQEAGEIAEIPAAGGNVVKRLYGILGVPEEEIAYTQDELLLLLEKGAENIRLYGDGFSIPLDREGISYKGIGKVTVTVGSDQPVPWQEKKIRFENIEFDDRYREIEAADTKAVFFWRDTRYDGLSLPTGVYRIQGNGSVEVKAFADKMYRARRFQDAMHGITKVSWDRQGGFQYGMAIYHIRTGKVEAAELEKGMFYLPLGAADGHAYMIWSMDQGGMTVCDARIGTEEREKFSVPYLPQGEILFDQRSASIFFFAGPAEGIIKYSLPERKAEKLCGAEDVCDIKICDESLIVCGELEKGTLCAWDTETKKLQFSLTDRKVSSAVSSHGLLYYIEKTVPERPQKPEAVIWKRNLQEGKAAGTMKIPVSYIPQRMDLADGCLYLSAFRKEYASLPGGWLIPEGMGKEEGWLKCYPVPKYRIKLETGELQRLEEVDKKKRLYQYKATDGKEVLETYYDRMIPGIPEEGFTETKTLCE